MIVKTQYGTYRVQAIITKYINNEKLAIALEEKDGFPFCNLTVNLEGYDDIPDDCAFVDSNNCPWAWDFIEEYELGEFTGEYGCSGFCMYPPFKFDFDAIDRANEVID